VGGAFLELGGAVVHRGGTPEGRLHGAGLLEQLALLPHLHEHDVPRAHRHDDEDDERAARHEVAALPQRLEAVGVVDDFLVVHRRGRGGRGGGAGGRRGAGRGVGVGGGGGRRRGGGGSGALRGVALGERERRGHEGRRAGDQRRRDEGGQAVEGIHL